MEDILVMMKQNLMNKRLQTMLKPKQEMDSVKNKLDTQVLSLSFHSINDDDFFLLEKLVQQDKR